MAECGYKTIWKLVNTTTNVKVTQETTRFFGRTNERTDGRTDRLNDEQTDGQTILQYKSIKETYALTKVHEDWARNATSRKTAPPPGGQFFSPHISTNFELV
ncbi:hypothetical protein DPMN_181482 [Dreissena polymorpha]|uniref:Uncharacterized protein n=1 Tax=Dreissena polymorpha TaxID=45954 RepID=A0A9D4DEJ3_DREPO|nr:hypothetical protein DPMN_181482 [Dreissena polymorpha]